MSFAMPVVDPSMSPSAFNESRVSAPSAGSMSATARTETERNLAIAAHLSPFGLFVVGPLAFLAPLVVWLVGKDKSGFVDDHGREILNFMISMVLWIPIMVITIIGIPFLLVLPFVAVISPIRAAIAAGRGEYFRYPMTFRML